MQRTENGGTLASRVLLVDDDRDLLDLLAFLVSQAGLAPVQATNPAEALEAFERNDPSVAVVDLNMGPWDGFELIAELRRRNQKLPILVLTGRQDVDDKVRALDMGADDYVVKPFAHRELVARIRAHTRHAEIDRGTPSQPVLAVGGLRLDLRERLLFADGESFRLTGTEFRLLECLMRNGESVVATETLARAVWGYSDAPTREVIRVTLHRLRRKLGDDGSRPKYIETVTGVGLRLRAQQSEQETEPSV